MSQQKNIPLPGRLRAFRGRTKLSQEELAERLGVSGNYISMMELGKKVPGPSLLKLFESMERISSPTSPVSASSAASAPPSGTGGGNPLLALLSTETLIQNFVEVAEKLPLDGVPEKKRVVGNLREFLDEIERRLLASSGALSEAQQIAMRAARSGGRPGTK